MIDLPIGRDLAAEDPPHDEMGEAFLVAKARVALASDVPSTANEIMVLLVKQDHAEHQQSHAARLSRVTSS